MLAKNTELKLAWFQFLFACLAAFLCELCG